VNRLGYFCQLGSFWEAYCDILKMKSSPNRWPCFWLLFAQANLLHFHLNKQPENMSFVGILRFQKWFDVDVLNFLIEFRSRRYFGMFWLGDCFC